MTMWYPIWVIKQEAEKTISAIQFEVWEYLQQWLEVADDIALVLLAGALWAMGVRYLSKDSTKQKKDIVV
jgi:hypothetical protein